MHGSRGESLFYQSFADANSDKMIPWNLLKKRNIGKQLSKSFYDNSDNFQSSCICDK